MADTKNKLALTHENQRQLVGYDLHFLEQLIDALPTTQVRDLETIAKAMKEKILTLRKDLMPLVKKQD